MSVNITCLMSFFASAVLESDRWDLCEEDSHCLCGKWSTTEPLCAPPNVVETYCGLDHNNASLVKTNFIR